MGVGKQANLVYLIDFGLSKEFRDSNTRAHIPRNQGLGLIRTTTFASVNSHLGLELGRRDNLESLAYILLYFLWGFLPWQALGQQKHAILESKQRITTFKMFEELPAEFRIFLEHSRSLTFEGKPDYDHFYDLFNNLLSQKGFRNDMVFDWDVASGKDLAQDVRDRSGVLKAENSHFPKRRTG